MKRMILIAALLLIASPACSFRGKASRVSQEPAAAPTALQPAQPGADSASYTPPATLSADSAPDFSDMTFVEKNNLYLQLLSARQAEGMDTAQAEETYMLSVEATLEGDSALADQYLEQAILLLWK